MLKLKWRLKNTADINDKTIEFNELNDALLDMPPNHIGRWTYPAFKYYAMNNNFTVLEHKYEPANFLYFTSQFLKYRLLKSSQNVNSLSHKLFFSDKTMLRNFGLIFLVFVDILFNLNMFFKLAVNIKTIGGDSQFVRLRKIK